jgi:hypothetical protein
MSFGFSVGDFLDLIDRAQKIRKDFNGAPDQFKGISDEYVYEVDDSPRLSLR